MPIVAVVAVVAVVAIAVVGVACDKLQKITWYIVNNNKYIAQPDNSTPGTLYPMPGCATRALDWQIARSISASAAASAAAYPDQ